MHSLNIRTHQRSARWHRAGTRHCIESAVANAARRRTINGADTTGYTWDNANQLTGITFKLPGQPDRITSYTHDAAGQMTSKTLPGPNGNPGIKTAYSFDAAGRLTQIEWRNPPYALADQIDAISYTYDANGNRLTKTFSDIYGVMPIR